ncbi:MAG: multidrug efflux SMR transporter [Polyangiaceae bacterium]|nr:multidrug efflux SMR transporter [Polyangiaceae bacterium]
MAWIYVLLASVCEIALTLSLKLADGFKNPKATVATFVSAGLGFFFLGLAVKTIPIGTAYSVWVGIGIAGTSAIGILMFNESASPARLVCIALVLLGVVGLKVLPSGAQP